MGEFDFGYESEMYISFDNQHNMSGYNYNCGNDSRARPPIHLLIVTRQRQASCVIAPCSEPLLRPSSELAPIVIHEHESEQLDISIILQT